MRRVVYWRGIEWLDCRGALLRNPERDFVSAWRIRVLLQFAHVQEHGFHAELGAGLSQRLVHRGGKKRFDPHPVLFHSITPRERTRTSAGISLCDSTVRLGSADSAAWRRKCREPALAMTTADSNFSILRPS